MSLNKVLEVARSELGNTESPPNSNNTKYGEAYGLQGQPWCVIFLWWVFKQAGESAAFFGGAKTASCGTLFHWYKAQGQTVPVSEVQPGDIVILDFSGRQKDTQHCGLVTKAWWGPYGIDRFETIEGNTTNGVGQQDNGGAVCEKTRYPSQVVGVCRPKYKEDEMPKDDINGHWAEREIRHCIRRGIIKGYPDGSFRPEQTVTRAELAAVVDRLTNLIIGGDDGK